MTTGIKVAAVFLRSLLFNLTFYSATILLLILPLPVYFFLPRSFAMWVVTAWGRTGVFLLRTIARTRLEVRGRENIPKGGVLVAAKHQSMFETIALVPLFRDPAFVMKDTIKRIPIFGQYTIKAGMIHVDRTGGMASLRGFIARVRREIERHRPVIIFPEGTRRTPGAPPDYQGGIAHLYRALGAPVVPTALNSGLYWPRRKFLRYPGTIVFEFLPPIPPGLDSRVFLQRLSATIETASDRLLVEADRATPRPPFPPVASQRLLALRSA